MELRKSLNPNQVSWRDVLPVHPAAELFDLMSEEELKVLAGDIVQANGLRNPIIIYIGEDGIELLIDGRNRLEALQLAGFEPVKNGKFDYANVLHQRVSEVDPYDLALSLNLHRRHLDLAAKRKLIAKLLKLKPEASDRQIAKLVAVSHNTVKVIRRELEGRGQIDHVAVHIDTAGREQPATKTPKPNPATEIGPVRAAGNELDHHRRAAADHQHGGEHDQLAGHAGEHAVADREQHNEQHVAGAHHVDHAGPARAATGATIVTAFNRLTAKGVGDFLAQISPAHQCALKQHFAEPNSEKTKKAEIAKLALESMALLTHFKHNVDDIRKRLARIISLADPDPKLRGTKEAAKSARR